MYFVLKKYYINISKLSEYFKVNVRLYIEKDKTGYKNPFDYLEHIYEKEEYECYNFWIFDKSNYTFPYYDITWDLQYKNDKIKGCKDLEAYKEDYKQEIDTLIQEKTMAFLNTKNKDYGLANLAIFVLKNFNI